MVGMGRITQARRSDASKERKKKENKTSQTLKGLSTAQRWLAQTQKEFLAKTWGSCFFHGVSQKEQALNGPKLSTIQHTRFGPLLF